MKNAILYFALALFCIYYGSAQAQQATAGEERLEAASYRNQMIAESSLSGIQFRSVGPTVMSGRVVDLAVDPRDATHFFVAYASGGLWETRNNGQSFSPIFDQEAVMTIGAIAVQWSDTSIWIGTGEVNSSRSSYAGLGMYHSTDQGKTWTHRGLSDSQHIGRVVLHPSDANTLWVASLGPLYTGGGERGIYRSQDAGKTWQHALNLGTGAVDLEIDPSNADILYASLWERDRKAWNFTGNGAKSGIYQSTDGGTSWSSMTGAESGFAQGEGLGRIGLSVSSSDTGTVLYAMHDNQSHRPKSDTEVEVPQGLERDAFLDMDKDSFLALPEDEVQDYLEKNNFPKAQDYAAIREMIQGDEISPKALYDYLSDANSDLFDTPVIGAEVYRYDASTSTWAKTHEGYLDDVVYSYGYYFGLIEVHPRNPEKVYIGGVPLLTSDDGGKHWRNINPQNVHADHHALWIDPARDGHLISGNDGGINMSYDDGVHYVNCNSPAVGQFYTVAVDNAEPYNIYGGLQDNGVWKGPSTYTASDDWHMSGHYPYESIMGGDGMQIAIDSRDNETVYTGYQFGHYYRLKEGEEGLYIHPGHKLGELPLRWNWQTPIHLSSHNQDILYMASDKVHRSMDQGATWETLSPDLTVGGKAGNVPFGTISSIDESPLQFGLLYAGSDDGRIHRSADAGATWIEIGAELPADYWVTRIEASHHKKGRVYASLNGYRRDDTRPLLYRLEAGSDSWEYIGNGLPAEAINVVLEDPADEQILYVGTDHGLYVSLDMGSSWQALMGGLPQVPVHDLVIQERENDLVVGTHGRSIYVAQIDMLRAIASQPIRAMVFTPETLKGAAYWGKASWSKWFGFNEPETEFYFYSPAAGNSEWRVLDEQGLVLNSGAIASSKGLHSLTYDLTMNAASIEKLQSKKQGKKVSDSLYNASPAPNGKYYLPSGEYTVEMVQGSSSVAETFVVE